MAALIDLHTHTTHSSPCSHMNAEELIEAAIEAGLDGVAVTEHSAIEGAEVAQEIARRKYGFAVFRGVEAHATILGDVLVFGCYRDFEPGITSLALRQLVQSSGGLLIPAHPFRHWDRCALWFHLQEHNLPLDRRLADRDLLRGLTAVETVNGGCKPEENEQAAELARILGVPGIGGSDAHRTEQVGRAATWFPSDITTDADLVAALKAGGYRPVNRWSGE